MQEALRTNLEYQTTLRQTIAIIDVNISQTVDALKSIAANTAVECKLTNSAVFAYHPLMDDNGQLPPLPSSMEIYKSLDKAFKETYTVTSWHPTELQSLKHLVNEARRSRLLYDGLDDALLLTDAQLEEDYLDVPVDWVFVSSKVKSRVARSPNDCRNVWISEMDPRINRKQWKKSQVKNLVEIAENKHACRNWNVVAEELNVILNPFVIIYIYFCLFCRIKEAHLIA